VYIHRRYLRVYPRREQVPCEIGLCRGETGGLFRMPEIAPVATPRRQTQLRT
jgi:hypothetical protein